MYIVGSKKQIFKVICPVSILYESISVGRELSPDTLASNSDATTKYNLVAWAMILLVVNQSKTNSRIGRSEWWKFEMESSCSQIWCRVSDISLKTNYIGYLLPREDIANDQRERLYVTLQAMPVLSKYRNGLGHTASPITTPL